MKKTADGRWPAWLRSFRYRLVFFSTLTITAVIAVFGFAVFSLFTLMELERVDSSLDSASSEITGFLERAGRLPHLFWQDRTRITVFQVYDSDLSLLFHLPPGESAPTLGPSDLSKAAASKGASTFDSGKRLFLPRQWWALPWKFLYGRDLWRISVRVTAISGAPATLVAMFPLSGLLESRHLLLWMIILAGTASILLSLVVGERVAGEAMKPLKRINSALAKVSVENMIIDPLPGETDREILDIVNHIRRMLQGLDQSFRNLQQFTSDASHELRTPLAVMRGTVDVALMRERNSEYYIGKLHEILYSVEDMQNLVGALLELARLDNIKGLDSMEPADLLLAAEDAVSNLTPLIARRGQDLREELEPAPTRGRDSMILRLVSNLLENASKHSPPGSSIGIRTRIDDERGESVVEVWDHGPGLDPGEVERCFDRFWRADFSRSTPGFGLGLPLAHRIAQIHGGEIEIESQKGKGSTFRARFPLDRDALNDYDFE